MSAKVKVYIGVLLCSPLVLLSFWIGLYTMGHPRMTQTEILLTWAPYEMPAVVAAVAGAVILGRGWDENDDE